MKVHELIAKLQQLPQDAEVVTKKTEIFGTVGEVNDVQKSTCSNFGVVSDCVILTDKYPDEDA